MTIGQINRRAAGLLGQMQVPLIDQYLRRRTASVNSKMQYPGGLRFIAGQQKVLGRLVGLPGKFMGQTEAEMGAGMGHVIGARQPRLGQGDKLNGLRHLPMNSGD